MGPRILDGPSYSVDEVVTNLTISSSNVTTYLGTQRVLSKSFILHSNNSEKITGIEHPGFKLKPEESYEQNVMERHAHNQRLEDVRNIIKTEVEGHGDQLIQQIEEYYIPLAINSFRNRKPKLSEGKFRWFVQHFAGRFTMRIRLRINPYKYMLKTSFGTYNMTADVCQYALDKFAEVTKTDRKTLKYDTKSRIVLHINFPIDYSSAQN